MKIYSFFANRCQLPNIHGLRPEFWWVVAHCEAHAVAFAEQQFDVHAVKEAKCDALQVMLESMNSIDAILDEDGNPLTLAQVQS